MKLLTVIYHDPPEDSRQFEVSDEWAAKDFDRPYDDWLYAAGPNGEQYAIRVTAAAVISVVDPALVEV